MSLFGSILEKLGLQEEGRSAAPAAAAHGDTSGTDRPRRRRRRPRRRSRNRWPRSTWSRCSRTWRQGNPQKLNWRTSIVDLMKLLGMESSLTERKELATELGCPAEYMHDSAKMNVWLHKQVLRQIAENGGNVPKELLD